MGNPGGVQFVDQSLDWQALPSLLAAAHELKAPLVLMRQLALELELEADPLVMRQSHERLRLTAERSLRLVEQLTRSARLDDALFVSEPLNLTELLHEVADELQPLGRQLGRQVVVCTPQRAPVVVANRELMRSIMTSLGDNALHYTASEQPVELRAVRQGDAMRVGVRDYGPAMSRASFRQLHQRLGKSPQLLSGRPRSSGLGLLIADSFARQMQSSLQVVRHRESGLTFQLCVPLSRQLRLFG